MKNTNASFREKFRYQFDNFFARGGFSIFLALLSLFGVAMLTMGGIRVFLNLLYPDPLDPEFSSLGNQIWRVMLQIVDIGSLAEDSNASRLNKGLGIITSLLGLSLVSTLLAFITSIFKEKLESLKKGKSAVIESGHTLILGFSIRSVEIIRELIEANASEKDAAVVVLAATDKETMDDFFYDHLVERFTTRIITRSGSTSNPVSLKKAGVSHAGSIVILNAAGPADPPEMKSQADYQVFKSIMAIVASTGEETMPPVVAELHCKRNRELAESISPGHIATIDENVILAKILVQTSRTPGLSVVYSDLAGFIGNEIYFELIPDRYHGLTFGEMQFYFKQSVPFGIRNCHSQIFLNPNPSNPIEPGDEVIILAEDDSTIHFHEAPFFEPESLLTAHDKRLPEIEKYLIIGWSKKCPIIVEEYGAYITKGSIIHVVVNEKTSEIVDQFNQIKAAFPDIDMVLIAADTEERNFPVRLKPETYDNVIILAGEGNNAEIIDSITISLLLKFRHYFRQWEQESGTSSTTQLITEVMDSENTEIIQQTGVKDFLISNQFVSKIMAQVSQEPAVLKVYDDLFREAGSEIYLKPIQLYLKEIPERCHFADLMLAAQSRSEICFGVKVAHEADDTDKNYGVYIIPDKDAAFELTSADQLITLAEDEF